MKVKILAPLKYKTTLNGIQLFLFLILFTSNSFAQITGTVFRDYNVNGSFQPNAPDFEIGIPGVIINAYDATNTVISTTNSANDGTYTLPFSVPVRLEFEMSAPTFCVDSNIDFNSVLGNGENIRFVTIASNNVNYGIQNPEDYVVSIDPNIFITQFNRGDPLLAGTSATAPALYGYPYSSSNNVVPTYTAPASGVGAIWGLAYSAQAKKIFAAAFLKRYSGYGPLGSGGIYMMQPTGSAFTVTNFYDMDANGHRTRALATAVPYGIGSSLSSNAAGTIPTYLGPIDPVSGQPEGLGVIGVNGPGGRDMTPSTSDQWNDAAAMDQVAKVGLGDIDISDDGKFLFVTNLYSRMLFRLELDNAYNPQSVIGVDSFSMPPIVANNGLLRCFGIAYHRGKVYLGAVSTGENGGQNNVGGATDLNAYVFVLNDPLGNAVLNPLPIITFPLNYQKGAVIGGSGPQWFPWNKDADALLPGEIHLPTPILSDIEFSDKGDLIMDFCDRTGHQFANNSRRYLTGTIMSGTVDIGGDILIAGWDCGTGSYTLENNGSFTSNGTVFNGGVGNGEGIGGGEFFFNDEWSGFHHETSVGSCAVLRGRDQVLVTLMDPVTAFSNGTAKFSTTTAINSDNLSLAGNAEFGKANSLGDIEVAGDDAKIQIGNRVWNDANNNGIQDPLEVGIGDVSIDLFADFNDDGTPDGPSLANGLTDIVGGFFFSAANVPDGDPSTFGLQPGIATNRIYLMKINVTDWNNSLGTGNLLGYSVTLTDVGANGQADVRDNDGYLSSNVPTIRVDSLRFGKNGHQFDFGFFPCPLITPSDVTLNCTFTSTLIGPTEIPGNTYLWTPIEGLSNPTIAQPTASPNESTIYKLTINGLCTFQYVVFVDNDPPDPLTGPDKFIECENPQTLIGEPAEFGTSYTYSWSPGISLNDSTIAQPLASPSSTTTYTLTVTGLNGCDSSKEITVNSEKCCSKIVMPNSFSPNNDQLNDEFGVIIIENVETFYLTIYDRWGERVFETEDPKVKWNGWNRTKDADVGTYYYYIKYNCQNFSKPRFLKGDVTLIR